MPTLFVSPTSPYARILIMIAYLEGIDLSLKFVMPWDNPPELTVVNPFSQVPTLQYEDGTVITETALIIQAIAPHILTADNLPKISQALSILWQGVRAYSVERFGIEGQLPHPFVERSTNILANLMPTLPNLDANRNHWGERMLLCALYWVGFRLPHVFEKLSDDNKKAVTQFSYTQIMQKTTPDALSAMPATIHQL